MSHTDKMLLYIYIAGVVFGIFATPFMTTKDDMPGTGIMAGILWPIVVPIWALIGLGWLYNAYWDKVDEIKKGWAKSEPSDKPEDTLGRPV